MFAEELLQYMNNHLAFNWHCASRNWNRGKSQLISIELLFKTKFQSRMGQWKQKHKVFWLALVLFHCKMHLLVIRILLIWTSFLRGMITLTCLLASFPCNSIEIICLYTSEWSCLIYMSIEKEIFIAVIVLCLFTISHK